MKIAVTFDNGEVFQHFGQTKNFRIYEAIDTHVKPGAVIPVEGEGHDAVASFLAAQGVDVVICGGIGEGAQNALAAAGIQVVSGAEGDTDSAIFAFLNGELTSDGVNCGCHGGDDAGCGCEGGCGGGCGGCGGGCGGCGEMQPIMEGKNVGKTCKVHYRGTLNDGTQFDSSYDRNEPLEFVCGVGMMIRGFDEAVADMEVGEEIDIHILPEDAYGPVNPELIITAEIAQLKGSENLAVGAQVYLSDAYGRPIPVKVIAKDDVTITLDANHEMAGKELNFHIQLVEVQ